jgi:hypothetical protein
VETQLAEFVNLLTDELLEKRLPIRTTQVTLAHLMQHLANHSTYCRALRKNEGPGSLGGSFSYEPTSVSRVMRRDARRKPFVNCDLTP